MKITRTKELTYDELISIYAEGISGGDQDDRFAITRIGKEQLTEPILIPHEVHHLIEAANRIKAAVSLSLKKCR